MTPEEKRALRRQRRLESTELRRSKTRGLRSPDGIAGKVKDPPPPGGRRQHGRTVHADNVRRAEIKRQIHDDNSRARSPFLIAREIAERKLPAATVAVDEMRQELEDAREEQRPADSAILKKGRLGEARLLEGTVKALKDMTEDNPVENPFESGLNYPLPADPRVKAAYVDMQGRRSSLHSGPTGPLEYEHLRERAAKAAVKVRGDVEHDETVRSLTTNEVVTDPSERRGLLLAQRQSRAEEGASSDELGITSPDRAVEVATQRFEAQNPKTQSASPPFSI